MINIRQKQYVLSNTRHSFADMREFPFSWGYLYAHEALNVLEAVTKSGQKVCLVGHAFCMDAVGKMPIDDIASWDTAEPQGTAYWTGRFALITDDFLCRDAAGLMGAFYTASDGTWTVSSSLSLLAELMHTTVPRTVSSTGISWQILPDTLLDGVSGLLCTQILQLRAEGLTPVFRDPFTDKRSLTTAERAEEIAALLTNGAANIASAGHPVTIALTGGKDSRLVLAAARRAKIKFDTYTMSHQGISSADKTIPPKLAARFGFSHRYIQKRAFSEDAAKEYLTFTGGNSNGADLQFYACGQFAALTPGSVILRGGLFEAGQSYARSIAAGNTGTFADEMSRYYAALREEPHQKAAFDKWMETVRDHPIPYMDIRDRFYIEQRVGGWAAAIEQSLDINEFISIQIADCAALLSVLLSANEEERARLAMSYDTMRLLEPALTEYAVNRKTLSDKLGHIADILRHPAAKLRNYLNKRR